MNITPISTRRSRAGYGLLVVIISLALLTMVFASMLYWSTSNSRITLRNNLFNSAEAAAESATENTLAYMMRDFSFGSLGTVSSYNTLAVPTNGWPIYYQFSDTNGNTAYSSTLTMGSVSTSATNLGSQFSGLFGFVLPVQIASTAKPLGLGHDLSATVYQSIQFALVPLFQFAIFYNMDLEINPGASMTVNGRVHSNQDIWATGSSSGSPLIFSSAVDAAGTVSNQPSSLDPQNQSRSGNVTYSSAGNPLQNSTSMSLPIAGSTNNNPTNVLAILNAPPSTYAPVPGNYASAYSTNGMVYLANAVDLIISNAATGTGGTQGTNITVYYQNPNSTLPLTLVPKDIIVSSNVVGSGVSLTTNITMAYSFVTNAAYYDYREGDTAQAVQIDVAKLGSWITNSSLKGGATYNNLNISGSTSKAHGINSVYVYNSVPRTTTQFPAVRMVNGSKLPLAGLTVATADPIYVKGDYNTTTNGINYSTTLGNTAYTAPAALLADAVTILSSNWSDDNTSSTSLSSRTPANVVVNAAALEGIVPSDGSHYSGGVENFLRLLENWSGHTVTYNGSIVVMFPSQIATNYWQSTGNYYNAPTRQWGFDLNFNTASKLPPLTPTVKVVIRGNWSVW